MRQYIFFILLFITKAYSQEYSRSIDLFETKKIIYNENYIDVQDFTNALYKEDSPCMKYFERIQTKHSDFEVQIIDAEYELIEKTNLPCNIPTELQYDYSLSQLQKNNFVSIEIFPYTRKLGGIYFLKSFKIKIKPNIIIDR